MFKVFFILLIPVSLFAQQLVADFAVPDSFVGYCYGSTNSTMGVYKSSGSYIIYELITGVKVATLPVPDFAKSSNLYYMGVGFVNADNKWFTIASFTDTILSTPIKMLYSFQLYNGKTLILKDSGNVTYNESNNKIYLYTLPYYAKGNVKVWELGSVSLISSLSKKAANYEAHSIFNQLPSGALQITTQSNNDGTTFVQLFDLTGRMAYSGSIVNNKSVIIPVQNIPNSPFVARVIGNNSETSKQFIPIK